MARVGRTLPMRAASGLGMVLRPALVRSADQVRRSKIVATGHCKD